MQHVAIEGEELRDTRKLVMQDHHLFGPQRQAGVSAAIVIREFDLEYPGPKSLHNRADLPSAQTSGRHILDKRNHRKRFDGLHDISIPESHNNWSVLQSPHILKRSSHFALSPGL
jgi:hypothetical protein